MSPCTCISCLSVTFAVFPCSIQVSEVLLGALQAYTDKSDFTEDQLVEASGGCKAAGQLCAWVLGVER